MSTYEREEIHYLRILKNPCGCAIWNARVKEGFEDFASFLALVCLIRLNLTIA